MNRRGAAANPGQRLPLAPGLSCAVERARGPVGGRYPTRQRSLQPETTGAAQAGNGPGRSLWCKRSQKGISGHAGRNMSERRAGLEKANVCAEPALNGRRPPWVLEASNTRTGSSRRGSGVDMRAKDWRVNTGDPPSCAGKCWGNRRPVRVRAGRGRKSERPTVCAEQRVVQEGWSPSGAQMRGAVSNKRG